MSNIILCPGKSVGAIIKNAKGEYLAQYRLKHPVGLAFVAGHIHEGEKPETAMIREVSEEVGLSVVRYSEILHQIFPNECSRGPKEIGRQYDGHEWWVYDVTEWNGEPKIKEPEAHKFVKFMSLEEMLPYIKSGETDPAWFKYILPALKIL